MLDWIAHMAFVLNRTAGTIKNKVGHLGAIHVEMGEKNPIDQMDRVSRAFGTLRRLKKETKRKFPAGRPMLREA